MRESRTGDSFWTRRSCRPVKRTYFLCVPHPTTRHETAHGNCCRDGTNGSEKKESGRYRGTVRDTRSLMRERRPRDGGETYQRASASIKSLIWPSAKGQEMTSSCPAAIASSNWGPTR